MATAEVIHTMADQAGSYHMVNVGEDVGAILEAARIGGTAGCLDDVHRPRAEDQLFGTQGRTPNIGAADARGRFNRGQMLAHQSGLRAVGSDPVDSKRRLRAN